MLLIAVILMDLLTGMEFDLFVPSFPELQSQFQLTPFWVETLLSANFIGYSLSLFIVGNLADRYGRKPIIVLGLLIFTVGSVLCVSAMWYPILLLGRFLQGLGIAAPSILSFLIIADRFSIKKQQFFMAMLNGSLNIAAAIAPVMGSYVALYFHWQGNFMVLLLLGLLVLAVTLWGVPHAKLADAPTKLSWQSYLPLFKSKPLLLLMVNIVCMFIPYWVFVGMSPLFYMQSLGVSLTHFGFYQGIFALVFACGSVGFGLMLKYFTQKSLLNSATVLYGVSLVCVGTVTIAHSTNPLWITLAFLPFIVAQIIPSNVLIPICLNLMPEAKGRVSAVLQGARLIFSGVSLQLVGLAYTGSFQSIGIAIGFFIVLALITHIFVSRNQSLMQVV